MVVEWNEEVRRMVLQLCRMRAEVDKILDNVKKLEDEKLDIEDVLIFANQEQAQKAEADSAGLQKTLVEKRREYEVKNKKYNDDLHAWLPRIMEYANEVKDVGLRCHSTEDSSALKFLKTLTNVDVNIYVVKDSAQSANVKSHVENWAEPDYIKKEEHWTQDDIKRKAKEEEEDERRLRKVLKVDSYASKKDEDDEDDKTYPYVK